MPDEAQQASTPDAQPAQPRRTAMQVAESALAKAQEADDMAAVLSEKVTDLDQRIRDRETAHGELRDDLAGKLSGVRPGDTPTRDQVDGRIHEALAPVEESLASLSGALRAVEGRTLTPEQMESRVTIATQPLREEFGGFAGAVNRKLDEMRQRLAALEVEAKRTDVDPISATMHEDWVSDQVESQFRQRADGILARLEQLERRSSGGDGTPGLTWDAIAKRVDNQAKNALREAVAAGHIAGVPGAPISAAPRVAGVHAKVLQVMRDVGAIGKDRETDRAAGGYNYRGIDDAMDAVGHAMREVGLVYTTQIVDRQVSRDQAQNREGRTLLWTSVMLTVRYTFIDPEDGSTQTFEMAGEGRDSGDKATSKAAAMALKYGLLHALMIPVSGAIPDADAENPQVMRTDDRATAAQPQAPQAPPERTEQQRGARAVDAVRAIQNLHRHPAEKRHSALVSIGNQAAREGLLDLTVDTGDGALPVRSYLQAALGTMAVAQADDWKRGDDYPGDLPDGAHRMY